MYIARTRQQEAVRILHLAARAPRMGWSDFFRKDFFRIFQTFSIKTFFRIFQNIFRIGDMYACDVGSIHVSVGCIHGIYLDTNPPYVNIFLSIWRLQGMLHSSTCSKIFTKNHAVGKNTYLRLLMSSSWWMGSPPCQQIRGSQLSCRGWWCQGQHTWWRGWENVLLGENTSS